MIKKFIDKIKSFRVSKPAIPLLKLSKKARIIFLAGVGVVIVLYVLFANFTKLISYFVVAKVGDSYITRSEFDKELKLRYAASVIDNLATLKIVAMELARANVTTSDTEVTSKITSIEKSLGGAKLDDVLKAQGVERTEFLKQIKLQLGAEKLVKEKIQVTDDEIAAFMKDNASQLVSIVEADKKEEARDLIKTQKVQSEIATWLQDLKSKYPVTTY